MKFNFLEEREATATTPPAFVFEVSTFDFSCTTVTIFTQLLLSGDWHELINGEPRSYFDVKKFQGIGKSTREAKYACVSSALAILRKQMPGKSAKS